MRRLLILLLVLLGSASAFAAPPAGSLDAARVEHADAALALARIEVERNQLDRTHEALAVEIEALKAAADRPLLPGVRDPRLDDRLKQARSLAESLAALDRSATAARSRINTTRGALVERLDTELAARRAALAEAPALERRALFENLRVLIAERQDLTRPALPQTPSAPLPAPPTDAVASPDELRELADETRDHAEQVQGRLSMLETQLARLRERQRLVRAAAAFSRDDALFAQDERNRQVVRRQDGLPSATPTDSDRPERSETVGDSGEGEGVAVEDSAENADRSPEDPEAPPQAGGDDGDGAGFEADRDNAPDPGAGDELDGALGGGAADPIPPEGLPVGALDGPGEAGAVIIEEAFDPTLLDGLDELSPEALAQRIATIEARRRALENSRTELRARGEALEQRADALENE